MREPSVAPEIHPIATLSHELYNLLLPDCSESDLFVGGDDTSPSLCHAGDIAVEIPGGALSCTGLTPGSTATVSCEDGYEPSGGNGSLVCQDNGTWSGPTPTCEKLESECIPLCVLCCFV